MFQKEHPELKAGQLRILPNYPPGAWYECKAPPNNNEVKKMVYAGALSLDTMHTENLCNWILSKGGQYTLDIYSDNYTTEAVAYLTRLNCPFIRLHNAVSYYALPEVLCRYDIGLVIYNGHIPNYVYNVPNKVYEYYACGLEIWCSKDLLSVIGFRRQEQISSIRIIDFDDIDRSLEQQDPGAKETGKNNLKIFSAEAEYSGLLQSI
jgi:hypothetical protein